MDSWNIRLQIIFVISLAIAWSVGFSLTIDQQQQIQQNQIPSIIKGKICQRISIWYWEDFELLRGCSVIEGSLQINIVMYDDLDGWTTSNMSFPDLREITGFLMMFSTERMISLKHLFPNLAVIRGQELVENFALVVFNNQDMQEIGLPSLTNIMKGGVWIVDNENLCYVDTVDWTKIVAINESVTEGIFKNKQKCPNSCKDSCPSSTSYNYRLCWSKDHCQVVPCAHCNGKVCFGEKKQCCHPQCLGGCFGPGPHECHVCKRVIVNTPEQGSVCRDKCPWGLYEYLERRCVTKSECLNITAAAPIKFPEKGPSTGKLYTNEDGTQQCVLECPKNTELGPNGTVCVPCGGSCKKTCNGRTVDSIEAAKDLQGCTRIQGALKIHIRRSSASASKTIVNELKENLDRIEEIDHYLAITYTYSIYSLDFLQNLRIIRGETLDDKKYALIVKSNENLMELWNGTGISNRSITIENKQAKVLFHYNPKLCPVKIWEFVMQSGIEPPARNDTIDIGVTNGDKVPCNTKRLELHVVQKNDTTVTLRWENFRRNLTLTSHLLNYEIHYKETPSNPRQNESKFNDRDPCGDDGWNVQEKAKISDNDVKGGIDNEPIWESEALIANLKPYTWYAMYVKAVVIQDAYALNNNTGAESDIIYFRTLADYPNKATQFLLAPSGPDKITATWEPPIVANGELDVFKIYIKSVPESQSLQDQRNYCNGRPTSPTSNIITTIKGTDSFISTTLAPLLSATSKDSNCCSCTAQPLAKSQDRITQVYDEAVLYDIVLGKYVFNGKTPDDHPSRNEITKSPRLTRRRRSVDEHSPTSEETNELEGQLVLFPEQNQVVKKESPIKLPVMKGLTLRKEIPFNSSVTKYTLVLDNLTHYTTYHIGVEVCRKIDPQIHGNDTHTCSDKLYERIRTAPLPEADIIDSRTISVNVTGNKLNVRWTEPANPNGVIVAYRLQFRKIESSRDSQVIDTPCITRVQFLNSSKNYTHPTQFGPGNHSVSIRVMSLALDSDYSTPVYFYIEDTNENTAGFWILITLLPLLIMLLFAGCFMYWIVVKRYRAPPLVTSANPEYMANVDIPDEWEVERDNVKILWDKPRGQGFFGSVFEGITSQSIQGFSDIRCAVKTVAEGKQGEEKAMFLREAEVMTKLDCHHVVKLLGVVSKTQPIYVIMELMERDLREYLRLQRPDPEKNHKPPPPTLKKILRMAAEIADGMSYIHSKGLVHRDLAARNCLVNIDLVVKVGDFGMTKEITDYYRKQTKGLLPVRWMSPEALKDGIFTSCSDVWSFGVVLWEMATLAAQPYQGLSNSKVVEYVQSGRIMEMPERCPLILCELMTACWEFDYRHRPTLTAIIERLYPHLEPSFAQVSFYHSPEGMEFRTRESLRPVEEEHVTVATPLIPDTFDSDDESDYSDDHMPSGHIIDDLDDTFSASQRLLSSTPVNKPQIQPSSSPANKKPMGNGVSIGMPTSLLPISGNNGSYLRNGNSPPKRQTPPPVVPSINCPETIFPNPHLLINISPSNNNYTEPLFANDRVQTNFPPPPTNSIPLTPIKQNEINKSTANNKQGLERSANNRSPIPYTTVTPVNQIITPRNTTGVDRLDSNESSKSYNSVNCSSDNHKFGNGSTGTMGGNGYIVPPGNKTTQF